MQTKKIHRRYPAQKWNYKAIQTTITENGKKRNVIFYTLICNGKRSNGVEVYGGKNYIVGSKDSSYSRNYKLSKVPQKYKDIVKKLKSVHSKTKWQSSGKVEVN